MTIINDKNTATFIASQNFNGQEIVVISQSRVEAISECFRAVCEAFAEQ